MVLVEKKRLLPDNSPNRTRLRRVVFARQTEGFGLEVWGSGMSFIFHLIKLNTPIYTLYFDL